MISQFAQSNMMQNPMFQKAALSAPLGGMEQAKSFIEPMLPQIQQQPMLQQMEQEQQRREQNQSNPYQQQQQSNPYQPQQEEDSWTKMLMSLINGGR